ncbi:MAG: hypothetical protein P9L97_05640 [Candidatus Tenebribacter davisii]|nr:hypothetical protein [Candidatus Tenebribacter davisii]
MERETVTPTINSTNGFRGGSKDETNIKKFTDIYDIESAKTLLRNQLSTNPIIFEFLMGWPINWTSLKPLKKIVLPKWTINNLKKPKPIKSVKYQKERIHAIGNGQVPLCVYSLLKLWLLEDIL